jgi:hypothetical protein
VSVQNGLPETSRSWRLRDDRTAFDEEPIAIGGGTPAPDPTLRR